VADARWRCIKLTPSSHDQEGEEGRAEVKKRGLTRRRRRSWADDKEAKKASNE
jgi:hypothetical protein